MTIVVVDDDAALRFTLEEILEEAGHTVRSFAAAESALEALDAAELLLTDLVMPGALDGMALLAESKRRRPELPVILLTAHGSERTAVKALKAGAYDYLSKPFDIDELHATIARGLEATRLRRRNAQLAAEAALGTPMIAGSPAMQALLAQVERLARRNIPVLIRGETGSGKEIIASLLHAQSPRASQSMLRFNCAAIPESLAEAELFGHDKGAFTGATSRREGYFARADGAMIMLDEIGELSLSIQAKLLRTLQSGEIQPVGASRPRKVDVRVIACSHQDLRERVDRGSFREDLYYRLAVVELVVPALRDRREDIPALARLFCRQYAARFGIEDAQLRDDLLEALQARSWPGNVRELENCVARMLALSPGGALGVEAMRPGMPAGSGLAPAGTSARARLDLDHMLEEGVSYREQMMRFERELLRRCLESCAQNRSEAARRLQMSRSSLIDKIKRHDL